jgi:subfamily B ATP-binding cassette protein MsbA
VQLSRRLRTHARESQERTGDVATVIDETARGIRVVQNFGMAEFLKSRFGKANQRQYRASMSARAIKAANAPVMEIVGAFAALAVIGYASIQISRGGMTLGDFTAFTLGAYAVYNPLKRLNKFNLAVQQASVAASRVYDIIDTPPSVVDRPDARHFSDIGDGVRFEDVCLAYSRRRSVLRGFELHVPQGSSVALVGASGAGKSTAVQMIPRFFDPQQGRVTIGSRDVRSLELASLRARIGYVSQETLLFNDTIWTNIVCGRRGIGEDDVADAVRAADAEDFVRQLPDRYDTVVGEGGIKLSGGQRQRLAIARALLLRPWILILDEATSMLDPESEQRILSALNRFLPDATVVVVSHRLSVIRSADLIAVLADGGISQIGTHDELTATGGAYRRLVEWHELT